MYRVKLTAQAKRELKVIKKLYKDAIDTAFDDLAENPYTGKPLTRELKDRFSYKIGVYRIIYRINEKNKIIYVLTAGHRAKIYS